MSSSSSSSSARSGAIVMFGVTGDLAYRRLFPALAELARDGRLPERVVGVASSPWDTDRLRDRARESLREHGRGDLDEGTVEHLVGALRYVSGDYREPDTYARLRSELGGAERPLLYLAIPPSLFEAVVDGVVGVGLNEGGRLAVEKPFGRDRASAQWLNRCILRAFPEDSVFRIDHFLGKEQVLDLLVFRLANTVLDPAWNRHYIDSVQITMAESSGIEGRGRFYDEVGTLRDVVQNHLLQVVAMVAMEPPVAADAQALRDEKVKVLRALAPLDPATVVRGQFDGYRDESGVAPDSDTETYVALKAEIQSWRWAGVPFYIRAGKRMPVTATDVMIEFKQPPQMFFGRGGAPPHPNHLLFRLKPGAQMSLGVQIKEPGEALVSHGVDLTYRYHEEREGVHGDAYARLLDEALDGDARLFARADSVEEAWRVVEPVLERPPALRSYAPGTWGPAASEELIAPDGGWHRPLVGDEE